MRRSAVLAAMVLLAPFHAAAAAVLTRRPDGTWRRTEVPGTGPRERLDVRPVPRTGSATVYDGRGRRVGTVESKPYGGAVPYADEGDGGRAP